MISSPWKTFPTQTGFPTNSQDLRQEAVGHVEATLNASAREVGVLRWGSANELTNDWMDVDVD